MPARSSKPWFHKKSGYWCTSKQGRRIYLDRDYKVAASKLRGMRAQELREEHCGTEWLGAPFALLADEFNYGRGDKRGLQQKDFARITLFKV